MKVLAATRETSGLSRRLPLDGRGRAGQVTGPGVRLSGVWLRSGPGRADRSLATTTGNSAARRRARRRRHTGRSPAPSRTVEARCSASREGGAGRAGSFAPRADGFGFSFARDGGVADGAARGRHRRVRVPGPARSSDRPPPAPRCSRPRAARDLACRSIVTATFGVVCHGTSARRASPPRGLTSSR